MPTPIKAPLEAASGSEPGDVSMMRISKGSCIQFKQGLLFNVMPTANIIGQ